MRVLEKTCWVTIIFIAIFALFMLVVFDVEGAESPQAPVIDGGGRLGFGYLPESDIAIVDFEVAIYINPEERFRGSVLIGMESLVEPPEVVYSELPYFAQCTIGGTLNYSVLYVLAQGYYAFVEDNDFDYQIKLAAGINYNMPYRASNVLRRDPPFSVGLDCSFGHLPNLSSYFANIDVALYVRPGKLINGVIFGGIEVLTDNGYKYGHSLLSFCPYQDRYSFGVALNVKMFSFKVEHYCIHPVWSNWSQFAYRAYAENSTKFSIGIQYQYPFRVKRIG